MSDSSTTPEKRLKFETSLCMATESFLCIWNDPWFNMYPLLDFKCRTGRKYWPRYEFLAAQPLFTAHIQKSLNIFLYKRKMFLHMENIFSYKIQCQPCKRLAGPIIPLAWSGKGFHTSMWSPATIIMCVRPFAAWWHPTSQPSNQPVDPRASLLLTSEFGKRHVNWVPFLCYANLRKPS